MRVAVVLDIFSRFSFSLSLEDGPIETEILSQRAVKPNQHTSRVQFSMIALFVGIELRDSFGVALFVGFLPIELTE